MSGGAGANNSDLLEAARSAMALAKKHGAVDCAATASSSRNVSTEWRDGKLEKVSDATKRELFINLYVDGKYGSMSTNDLRPDALNRFVEDAVGLVRALAKDPHRKLPDPALYKDRPTGDLEIFDAKIGELNTDMRLQRCKALEDAARSTTGPGADKIISVTTGVYDGTSDYARVSSNGFEGSYRSSSMDLSADVTVKDDDGRRPEDWASADTRFAADLPDPATIGKDAAERAKSRLNSKKIESGNMTILVEARAARSLLRHLTGPLSGGSLQQKESFLLDKLNTVIASKNFTLVDDPLLKRGLGSRAFDNEGISSKTRTLIDKGVLKSYLIDVYYGSKLGVAPTTGRTSNLIITPGKKSLAAMMKDMKDGLLITSFIGGNSNSTTGVFSLGITGYRIQGGEKKDAINEMNLSDKHLDFWKKLVAVGDDPYVYSSTRSPSLMFENVSIAGK
jgi:PmbA protein